MDLSLAIMTSPDHVSGVSLDAADEALVTAAIKDDRFFEALVERYETKLRRYVMRFINCGAEDAEDIVQETFVNAYRNLNGFDTALKFSSWIYRIAHNEAVSHLRRVSARPSTTAFDDSHLETLASEVNVERDLGQKMSSKEVRDAVYLLDPKYREALALRYFDDKSYEEIADILRKPSGSVSSLITRAKRLLAKELRKDHSGRPQP